MSFDFVGIDLEFKGKGKFEKAFVKKCNNVEFQLPLGKEILSVDTNYFRPTEVDLLIGDPSKAKNKLGWIADYSLDSLIKDMMQSDIALMKKEIILKNAGYDLKKIYE